MFGGNSNVSISMLRFNHFLYKHIHLNITVRQKIAKSNPNVASFDQKCKPCLSCE